jgi:hypothetical protein
MLQGCQMVCFHTKNSNSGIFWQALHWKMMAYFIVIWNILGHFGKLFAVLVFLPGKIWQPLTSRYTTQ